MGLVNDVGLIKLAVLLDFSNRIQNLKFPCKNSDSLVGAQIQTAGWGKTTDDINKPAEILHTATFEIGKKSDCYEVYTQESIDPLNILCIPTNGTSTCSGDSGSPWYIDDFIMGVTSFGYAFGCELGAPVGFTDLAKYADFIANKTGLTCSRYVRNSASIESTTESTTTTIAASVSTVSATSIMSSSTVSTKTTTESHIETIKSTATFSSTKFSSELPSIKSSSEVF